MSQPLQLQCPCGAVHLAIDAEPIAQLYCHCDDCRTAHAAAYVAIALYPAQSVRITQGSVHPRILKTTPRMACSQCGTHLFSEADVIGMRSVNAFLLPEGVFQPQMHIQCRHAVLPVCDDLPHYKEWPPMAGGSDETVDW
ncbi:MAG: GFA family protein [Cardiobacteriaceae bacterium]|nr:GFA family protein [Cardiobacteriaceae bacterium]